MDTTKTTSYMEISTVGLEKADIDSLIWLNLYSEALMSDMDPDSEDFQACMAALNDMRNDKQLGMAA